MPLKDPQTFPKQCYQGVIKFNYLVYGSFSNHQVEIILARALIHSRPTSQGMVLPTVDCSLLYKLTIKIILLMGHESMRSSQLLNCDFPWYSVDKLT